MPDAVPPEPRIETLCAEVDPQPASRTRPLAMSIVPSSVFEVDSLETLDAVSEGRAEGYVYTRYGNPNQAALEHLVARLEGGQVGLACASGMGAIAAALLADLRSGSRVVASTALYGPTAALLAGPLTGFGVEAVFVDIADPAAVEAALATPTAAVIVETISNPLLRIPDMRLLARSAHAAGARLIVDNTFASPYHCRPLAYGADVVVHSGTKYLGGHSDVTIGVVTGASEVIDRARAIMTSFGAPASPFDCWLTVRGIKTLALRMERSSANALAIAEYLETQPGVVAAVHYPGLKSHPQHKLAAGLLERGWGAMVSFDLRGGEPAASAFVRGLRRVRLAPSLGDVSTTISHPAKTSHRSLGEEGRRDAGIGLGLIRLSAGIEHRDDIIADLDLGLAAAGRS
ncbi:MAG TPA: PLP-dependent aspartate aminotransferase family protein [Dehalococcoidia bacterium]|nr:PLP-dependent aspartate aminotransferase family protein [Dehalococcoidia bacterium]